ncbi:MAG: pantoate--beta-alanine ligase [Deltaproteobacteria bacterium]|nr:pantoate--beta-alanine ligase [Deltaproteobacteria bacterium]
MVVFQKNTEMKSFIAEMKKMGRTIGFVPTMGYLHKGHLALVKEAKKVCQVVVVSIFVNPTQFGPQEDFERYPRDLERDLRMLEKESVDAVFMPSVGEIYPKGYVTYVTLKGLTDCLCGRSRPGHFDGVATVVTKLFNIVRPDKAFFGQKDGQQVLVIRKMREDLNMEPEIVTVPTVREEDGLALSSRNFYLSSEERKAAPVLYRGLMAAQLAFKNGERNGEGLCKVVSDMIAGEPLTMIDYVEIRSIPNLEIVKIIDRPVLLAAAVYFTKARLIDNVVLYPQTCLHCQ